MLPYFAGQSVDMWNSKKTFFPNAFLSIPFLYPQFIFPQANNGLGILP